MNEFWLLTRLLSSVLQQESSAQNTFTRIEMNSDAIAYVFINCPLEIITLLPLSKRMQTDVVDFNHDQKTLALQTDAELLSLLKAGRSFALRVLYDRYASLVYSLALKILENSHEAEDLTQEIFLILLQRNTYNPQRGSLSSFITIMTRSRAIDKLRERHTSVKFLQRWCQTMNVETFSSTPVEQAVLKERSQLVRNALQLLSEDQRQVLHMAYYEGLTQSEIAQRLHVPLGTIKTRARQGLLKLRQGLQDIK
jgi:RNA polymerase sigma-70 factor (ECF subfamily)